MRFRGEVIAERPLRDVRLDTDVVDLGRFDTALGKERFSGLEDVGAELLDTAIHSALRGLLREHAARRADRSVARH